MDAAEKFDFDFLSLSLNGNSRSSTQDLHTYKQILYRK